MRILDVETHLLTPVDLEVIDTHNLRMSPGHRYYQLTHDYLVPSLRQWLTAKQKSTRSGRMELRLAEQPGFGTTAANGVNCRRCGNTSQFGGSLGPAVGLLPSSA